MSKVIELSRLNKQKEKEEIRQRIKELDGKLKNYWTALDFLLKNNPEIYEDLFAVLNGIIRLNIQKNKLLKDCTAND